MFVGFVLWIWVVIYVFTDIFRSHDMSGWVKALWILVVFLLPVFGVLFYLLFRGPKMAQRRSAADAAGQEKATQEFIRSVTGDRAGNTADQLTQLAALRDSGVLTPDEFDREKAKVLARAV
jgi:hypothetical protein